jgi:N-acetylglucosaminyldiphosphoundecaprenol N-acetyl-beta-D-mannosaminyltransferase
MTLENTMPSRVYVAGCPVDRISLDDAVRELSNRIEKHKRTHVVFVNAAKVVQFRKSPDLRGAMTRADLLLADGVPVVWASRLQNYSLPGRVNGTDLMERMLGVSAARGFRVYLLGAQADVLERTVASIRNRYPGIEIAGYRHGYFSHKDEPDIVRQINQSRADLLFLGISTPTKELWGDNYLSSLNVAVCQGVGGSFDVLAGEVRRAPRWMQRAGLEWFFRLCQEPQRLWRRYLTTNSAFAWLVLGDLLALVLGRSEITTPTVKSIASQGNQKP